MEYPTELEEAWEEMSEDEVVLEKQLYSLYQQPRTEDRDKLEYELEAQLTELRRGLTSN